MEAEATNTPTVQRGSYRQSVTPTRYSNNGDGSQPRVYR